MNDASNESPTSEEGARQLYKPRREEVVRFAGGAGNAVSTLLTVRLRTPDPRLMCKLTLIGSAAGNGTAPGSVVLAGRSLLLWLYAVELDEVRGKWVPVTDLAGSTSAAPIALPANAALGGFSREFATSADGVEARVTVPAQAPGGTPGSLWLQGTFSPRDERINPWSDWDEVRRQCSIELITPRLDVP